MSPVVAQHPVRVLLAGGPALYRESLAGLMMKQQDFEIIGAVGDCHDLWNSVDPRAVDCLVLDLGPVIDSYLQFLPDVRERGVPVLVVTSEMSKANRRRLLDAGASGVCLYSDSPRSLFRNLRRVTGAAATEVRTGRGGQFSNRQREVLESVFEGLTNKEIAERIGASETAVKATLQQLFKKTGVRTRSQLVGFWLRQQAVGSGQP